MNSSSPVKIPVFGVVDVCVGVVVDVLVPAEVAGIDVVPVPEVVFELDEVEVLPDVFVLEEVLDDVLPVRLAALTSALEIVSPPTPNTPTIAAALTTLAMRRACGPKATLFFIFKSFLY